MKSKKTIRKMTKAPLTRAIAKLQREVGSINRKMSKLVKMADETERENRILNIEIIEVRGQLEKLHGPQPGTVAGYDPDQMPLWPELPNGEGVADA